MPEPRSTVDPKANSRGLQLALCGTALLWAVAAASIAEDAAQGLALRLQVEVIEPLLASLFLLFLLLVGFRALNSIAAAGRLGDPVLLLPRRSTGAAEWGTGAAVGWGAALAVLLPVVLSGHLHGALAARPGAALAVALAAATLLCATLAEEMVFRGYPFQRLAGAVGDSWASVLLSLLFAVMLVYASPPRQFGFALLDGFLFGLLLAMAYLRTHALWLGWGLHFAYRVVIGVLLGLPLVGHGNAGSVFELYTRGPAWLTGGDFGPDAAVLTAAVMVAGLAVLFRATREFAWTYTHRPLVAAGYEVAVAPPPAHVALEKAAAPPPPLVQIQPVSARSPAATAQREQPDSEDSGPAPGVSKPHSDLVENQQ